MIKKQHYFFGGIAIFLSCIVLSYSLFHSFNGQSSYGNIQVSELYLKEKNKEVEALRLEQARLIKRNQALKEETIDLDLLEELARKNGYAYPDEVIISNH